MSLNTKIKKNSKINLEAAAQEFSKLVSQRQKKQALAYFNRLNRKIQEYIEKTPKYNADLQSAKIQF